MYEIEQHIPRENWFVCLLFEEGYWAFQTIRKQQLTRFMPYWFDSTDQTGLPGVAIAAGGVSGWEAPVDAAGRRILEPQEEETVYQVFTGITPKQAKLYLQYTQRVDRMNLITPRPVPGRIGFWDGYGSPYLDPDPSTELWTVHDIYPHMNIENPAITGASILCGASFWITPYTYRPVTDTNKTLQFLRGEKPARIITMGDGDRPIKAPAWLLKDYKAFFVCPEAI